MLNFTEYREFRNGKRYQTSIERTMGNHSRTEEIANRSSSENAKREIAEFQTLTQETVNEQIRRSIALLTRQLEELTRLVQGMTTSQHLNSYPRTEFGTTSGTAMPPSDIPNWQPWSNMTIVLRHVITLAKKHGMVIMEYIMIMTRSCNAYHGTQFDHDIFFREITMILAWWLCSLL